MSVSLNLDKFICFKIDDKIIYTKHSFDKKEYEFFLQSVKYPELSKKICEVSYSGGINTQLLVQSSPIKFRDFIRLTYPKLVNLSDGSLKLYINPKLCGGMLAGFRGSQNVSDRELCDAIIKAMPEDTYRSINVLNSNYNFGGLGEKPSRIITLDPHDYAVQRFLCAIVTFFRGYKPTKAINGNLISSYLLGELEDDETEKLRAERDILEAFNQKRKMYIYISNDWEAFEVRFSDAPKGGCIVQ